MDRGFLFTTPMANMSRAGLKTNSRRLLQSIPFKDVAVEGNISFKGLNLIPNMKTPQYQAEFSTKLVDGSNMTEQHVCPYGVRGDRLYVRETYFERGRWELVKGMVTKKGKKAKWRFVPTEPGVLFDPPTSYRRGRRKADGDTVAWYKRSARFMPKAYSRLMLEIIDIRLERLQDITEKDAAAEGVIKVEHQWRDTEYPLPNYAYMASEESVTKYSSAKDAFKELWESIYGAGSWKLNPWVWVIKYSRVD
ncbi:MAG: hypothetical protein ACTS9Y_00355 [Methylophilus sp.]|uniref:hypothetical protein n=1 Tax=Methylophilus sp. TaxID=29541 RepID=UPI003FA0AF60